MRLHLLAIFASLLGIFDRSLLPRLGLRLPLVFGGEVFAPDQLQRDVGLLGLVITTTGRCCNLLIAFVGQPILDRRAETANLRRSAFLGVQQRIESLCGRRRRPDLPSLAGHQVREVLANLLRVGESGQRRVL